jgi:hypothetical protein
VGRDWIDRAEVEGPCEHGSEPVGYIKCWKIFEWLSDWCLFKGSAPWSHAFQVSP